VAPKIGPALLPAQPTSKYSAYPFQPILSAQPTKSKQGTGVKGIGGNAFSNRFLILFCKEERRRDRDLVISNCKLQIFQIQSEISNLKFEMVSKDWGLL
jgi:hypothetical protein